MISPGFFFVAAFPGQEIMIFLFKLPRHGPSVGLPPEKRRNFQIRIFIVIDYAHFDGGGIFQGFLPAEISRCVDVLLFETADAGHIAQGVFTLGDILKSRGNDRDPDLISHVLIDDRAEDNIGIFMSFRLNQRRGFIHFEEAHVGSAGDIQEHAVRTLNAVVFQQGR